jgi:hypothetical protein
MLLGIRALGRAVVVVSLFLLVMLGVTACSTAPRGSDVGHGSTRSGRPRPFTLSRHTAGRAAARIARSAPELRAKLTRCPGGPGCHGVPHSVWYVSAQRDGARIVDGSGFSERVYLGVVAFRTPRGARRFVSHIRHEHRRYDGVFSVALKPGQGRSYTPGERGVGSLDATHRRGWSGWVLDLQHAYTFWDGSESVEESTRKFMARRGRYVCAAFLDGRSPRELHHLVPTWKRLLAALS